jgi:hypothetical protein
VDGPGLPVQRMDENELRASSHLPLGSASAAPPGVEDKSPFQICGSALAGAAYCARANALPPMARWLFLSDLSLNLVIMRLISSQ